jgi:hypothetical protein
MMIRLPVLYMVGVFIFSSYLGSVSAGRVGVGAHAQALPGVGKARTELCRVARPALPAEPTPSTSQRPPTTFRVTPFFPHARRQRLPPSHDPNDYSLTRFTTRGHDRVTANGTDLLRPEPVAGA